MITCVIMCGSGVHTSHPRSVTEAVETALLETCALSLATSVSRQKASLVETSQGFVMKFNGGNARVTVMGDDVVPENIKKIFAEAA